MCQDRITFQIASHFLPKIALRLESLYQSIKQACEEEHVSIHHYALDNLIKVIKLIDKPELRSRFLKELMRIEHVLNKANTRISSGLYEDLHTQIHLLSHFAGRFGDSILQEPFLQSIRLSQHASHIDCEMYSPQLLLWLESDPRMRQRDLEIWLGNLQSLNATVALYLSILRDTAQFDKINASNGFYQKQLPLRNSYQLLLIRIDKSFGVIPCVQLGHHGLSMRFCKASTMLEASGNDIKLDLAICQL